MKLFLSGMFAVGLFVCCTTLAWSKDHSVRSEMIVSAEWLREHLNDKELILLHVGDKDEFAAGHIPRAQFISTADISTPRGQGLTLQLPPVEQLKDVFEKFGVSNNSRIVIYFGKDWVSPTARVYLTLDYLGLGDRTSMLDGGMPAWRAAGGAITADVVTPQRGSLTPKPRPDLIVDAAWVSKNLEKPDVRILDARAPQFYSGADPGRMQRAGRIPGAKSVPFSSLVEDQTNKFKSADTLRELFSTAGISKKNTVATYCHIGQQASLLYFIARYLGYDARLYDGSFEDWSSRSELPVEKTASP